MDRYDSSLIAIAVAKNMKCEDCPYKCRYASKTTRYVCETHWKNILDLVGYNKEKAIYVEDISNTDGLEGHYVVTPKYNVPVYIPKRTENGVPILPKEFQD